MGIQGFPLCMCCYDSRLSLKPPSGTKIRPTGAEICPRVRLRGRYFRKENSEKYRCAHTVRAFFVPLSPVSRSPTPHEELAFVCTTKRPWRRPATGDSRFMPNPKPLRLGSPRQVSGKCKTWSKVWEVMIHGKVHKISAGRGLPRRLTVAHDGRTLLDKWTLLSTPYAGYCFVAWVADGVNFGVYWNESSLLQTAGDQYQLRADGVAYENLPDAAAAAAAAGEVVVADRRQRESLRNLENRLARLELGLDRPSRAPATGGADLVGPAGDAPDAAGGEGARPALIKTTSFSTDLPGYVFRADTKGTGYHLLHGLAAEEHTKKRRASPSSVPAARPTTTITVPANSTTPSGAGKWPAYFVAAPTFDKTRTGWVFKTDKLGTGYYLDPKWVEIKGGELRKVILTRGKRTTQGKCQSGTSVPLYFSEFNPKALENFMKVDMRRFLTQPVPRKGGTVRCFIRREKRELLTGRKKVYTLYMEGKGGSPDRYLMTAQKRVGLSGCRLVVGMDEGGDMGENNVVGRLKATDRTSEEFQVFSRRVPGRDDNDAIKENEVAAVHYSAQHGRYRGPSTMRVVLGNNAGVEADSSLLHRMLRGSLDSMDEPCLVSTNPTWNAKLQAFVLNFHGRVTQASVKNFQLALQDGATEKIMLQFGRTHANEFTMDFCHPLSPLQAFAVALTKFFSETRRWRCKES